MESASTDSENKHKLNDNNTFICNSTASIFNEKDLKDKLLTERKVRYKSWKNALALSVGWLLLFTGFFPMTSLQSSMNDSEGVGTMSLSILNSGEMIGNLFLSNIIVFKIGNKWSIAIGSSLFSCYIAANFYPTWGLLTPMAAFAGVGVSMAWIAQNTYLTKLSHYYASNIEGSDFDSINIRFFGTFYAIYYSSNILGNIASSFILGITSTMGSNNNITLHYDAGDLCGYDYCNEDLGTSFHFQADNDDDLLNTTSTTPSSHNRTDSTRVYFLCGFCLCSTLLAALIITTFVDPLPKLKISEESEKSSLKQVGATFRLLTKPNMLLLLPLAFYNGLDNDFLYTEFTKAFVTCPLGIEYIGFVAACYGVMGPIMSFLSGWLGTKHTRAIPFIIAGIAHISCCLVMLYWKPTPGKDMPVYAMASAWGIGSGIWCSQLNAYFGIIFPNDLEAAFSNFHLWNAIGSMILYAASHRVCTTLKIYVMIGVLSTGLLGYITILIKRHLQNRRHKKTSDGFKQVTLVNLHLYSPS